MFKHVELVNYKGEPVALPEQSTIPSKVVEIKKQAAYHKGWTVVGFTRDALEKARKKLAVKLDRPIDEITDEMVIRLAPAPRLSYRYGVHSSAEEFAKLARSQGLIGVRVVEMKKGEIKA